MQMIKNPTQSGSAQREFIGWCYALNCVPKKICSSPNPTKYIGLTLFESSNQVIVRSLEWASSPVTSIFIRRGNFGHRSAQREDNVKSQRKEGHVITEAETGVKQLQAQECQSLLATTRS